MFKLWIRKYSTKEISSCLKGTVIKGINIMAGGKDTVAKDDSEYPEWLWKLQEPAKESEYSLEALRKQSKRKIIQNSL